MDLEGLPSRPSAWGELLEAKPLPRQGFMVLLYERALLSVMVPGLAVIGERPLSSPSKRARLILDAQGRRVGVVDRRGEHLSLLLADALSLEGEHVEIASAEPDAGLHMLASGEVLLLRPGEGGRVERLDPDSGARTTLHQGRLGKGARIGPRGEWLVHVPGVALAQQLSAPEQAAFALRGGVGGRLQFSADGEHLAQVCPLAKGARVTLYRVGDWSPLASWMCTAMPHSLAFSGDGQRLLLAHQSGRVRAHEWLDGALAFGLAETAATHSPWVLSAVQNPNFIVAHQPLGGRARVWSALDGSLLADSRDIVAPEPASLHVLPSPAEP